MREPVPAAPTNLAARLREATQTLHTQAERSGVMRALLQGTLSKSGYVSLLHNLHAIYAALEAALARTAGHGWIAAVHDDRLARRASLEADLSALAPGMDGDAAVESATIDYVQRLLKLECDDPAALIAHAYVRYLGDLSGGQLLGPRVSRMFGLPEGGAGTAFYRFAEPGALAQRFRAALSALPKDRATEDRIVAEACWAFAQHVKLFEQLQDPTPEERLAR